VFCVFFADGLCHDDLGYSDPQIYENPSCNERDPMQRDSYNSLDLTIKEYSASSYLLPIRLHRAVSRQALGPVKRWVVHVQLFFYRSNRMYALADVTVVNPGLQKTVKKVGVVTGTFPLLSS